MHANFGGLETLNLETLTMIWKPKNLQKTAIFEPKFFYLAFNKKNAEGEKLKFGHSMGRDKQCMHIKFEGSQSRDQNFYGEKWSKSDKFWSGISR